MEYVQLSGTDLVVSRIAFGGDAIGGHHYGQVSEEDAIATVRRALDLGINFFDTADTYGFGRSEEILARALGDKRKDVVISTKFGVVWDSNGNITHDINPKRVYTAVDQSLRRLKLECIPLYFIHHPDGVTPIESTMEALTRCQEVGKIRYVGCSNFQPELIGEAHAEHPITAVQVPYNLIDREVEKTMLPFCKSLGINVLAYFPLAQGLLTGKHGAARPKLENQDARSRRWSYFQHDSFPAYLQVVSLLKVVARQYGVTPAQLALRWILDNQEVACALVGAKRTSHVEENAGAFGWNLSEEDRNLLSGLRGNGERVSC